MILRGVPILFGAALLSCVPAGVCAADDDPCAMLSSLVSRPTVTTSACSVKPGDLLVETGYANATTTGVGAQRSAIYPAANVRFGVARGLELDVLPPSVANVSSAPGVLQTDAQFGAHYEFGASPRWTTGANVLATVPGGYAGQAGSGTGLTANVDVAYALTPVLGLATTLGYQDLATQSSVDGSTVRVQSFDPSLVAALTLPLGMQLFAEAYGTTSAGAGLGGRYGLDAGLQKFFGTRVALDVEAGTTLGVSAGSTSHTVGAGVAYRFGK